MKKVRIDKLSHHYWEAVFVDGVLLISYERVLIDQLLPVLVKLECSIGEFHTWEMLSARMQDYEFDVPTDDRIYEFADRYITTPLPRQTPAYAALLGAQAFGIDSEKVLHEFNGGKNLWLDELAKMVIEGRRKSLCLP